MQLMGRPLLTFILAVLAYSLLFGQEVRAIDGNGNNITYPQWGATHTQLLTKTSVDYSDGISAPGGLGRENPRVISNAMFAQSGPINDSYELSDFVWVFGQFIDHDISLTGNNPMEPLMIPVPQNDPVFDPFGTGNVVIPMFRSIYDPSTGTSIDNPRVHLNEITAFIDGSGIYGSDDYRAQWLREFIDGKLKTSSGNLLPYHTTSGEFNEPRDPSAPFMADDALSGQKLFVAGDIRANENPSLISMHTLFVREHNRICVELKEKHPDWSDEELYQHARRLVIGHIQSILYDEWLPVMGIDVPAYEGYNPNLNPGISNLFSAAAFRMGHTLLTGTIMRIGNDGEVLPQGNLSLRDAFFNPREIQLAGGIEPYIKGMGVQVQQELDCKIVDDIRNFLFGEPGQGGLDLAAINIMRGRERGLADYNSIRENYGFPRVNSFDEICNDVEVAQLLEELYGTVDNIDPWVGLLAEDHMPNAILGPTLMEIIKEQFLALRDGDRFYYENDPGLSEEEITEIKSTLLSDIIMRNTGISLMQKNVFRAMDPEEVPFDKVTVVRRQLDMVAFPNPVTDILHIKLFSFDEGPGKLSIMEPTGRSILDIDVELKEGVNKMSFNIGDRLQPGVFFARMVIGKDENTIKLIAR